MLNLRRMGVTSMQARHKKVAIYCRVASADQLSLNTQRERLITSAEANGYSDFEVYSDNGFSGFDFERPAFSKLEAAIQAGEIEAVIVRDESRISRNIFATAQWIERHRDKGIIFVSADLPVGDNYLRNRGCIRNIVCRSGYKKS